MKFISKYALLIVIIAILFLMISGNLLSTSPLIITVQLLVIILSIWARRSFLKGQFSIHAEPNKGPLVVTGPYRFIRHPMYAFSLIMIWSSVLGHLSYITGCVSLLVTFVVLLRVVKEEQLLRVRFPEYVEYSNKTKRIIPFLI